MNLAARILSPDNLRGAWEEVSENKGAAGADSISIDRWRRNWEERCVGLAAAVRANTYKPAPLRRFTIPKRDGSPRRMAILAVDDRVLQRAVLRVVDNLFNSIFLEGSYGYREGRGVRDAIPAILAHRDRGLVWVLDADIDECFPSLDHTLILRCFTETVDDPVVVNLVRIWLAAFAGHLKRKRGIPLGAVLSPLLCNILLHGLDTALAGRGWPFVRYADDFCVFAGSRMEAETAQVETAAILSGLKLRLEPSKTQTVDFESGFDFLGIRFQRQVYSFHCQGKRVERKGAFDAGLFYDYVPDGYA